MIDPSDVPPVSDDECLARFVTRTKLFRSDGTVKPDAFIPFKYVELSVTRHLHATEEEIWSAGHNVAGTLNRTLRGRADIFARDCILNTLRVIETPLIDNPNHADLIDWPQQEQDQKAIALKLAASATVVPL